MEWETTPPGGSVEWEMAPVAAAVERAFRDEYGKVVATLIRQTGDFELAEDAVQEALIAAMAAWQRREVPVNPGAWLTTTARRKAIDKLRRAANYARKQKELEYLVELDRQGRDGVEAEPNDAIEDDRLKLVFTCCHPATARAPPEICPVAERLMFRRSGCVCERAWGGARPQCTHMT